MITARYVGVLLLLAACNGTGVTADASVTGIDSPRTDGALAVDAVPDAGEDHRALHVAVLGSSTAFGKNLDVPMYGGRVGGLVDRWSDRYEVFLKTTRPNSTVVNLALPSYTTYSILPTGTVIPTMFEPGTGLSDPARNITRAMVDQPDAVIVNIPLGREVLNGVSVDTLVANLRTIESVALAGGAQFWVTTSNPPIAGTPQAAPAALMQLQLADARIRTEFGTHAIDFYAARALADGTADPVYTLLLMDNHPNPAGHLLLRDAVIAADVPRSALP